MSAQGCALGCVCNAPAGLHWVVWSGAGRSSPSARNPAANVTCVALDGKRVQNPGLLDVPADAMSAETEDAARKPVDLPGYRPASEPNSRQIARAAEAIGAAVDRMLLPGNLREGLARQGQNMPMRGGSGSTVRAMRSATRRSISPFTSA